MILEDNLKLAGLVEEINNTPKEQRSSSKSSATALSIASAIISDVKEDRIAKNIYPQIHWDFYHSHQEKYFVKRKYEGDEQFAERKRNAKVVNYIRFVVDLDTRFLYGRPDKIGRRYGDSDFTEARMREINKLISIDNLQMEAKRKACLYGEQGFRIIPVDKRTGSQVEQTSVIDENIYPHPVPLDPRETFFLLNPYGRIIAVVIKWDYKDYVDPTKTVEVTELITDDSRWKWNDDNLQEASLNKYKLREEFILERNNQDRIDTVQDMLPLQTSLNECLTDNEYFFARHGRPQLVSEVDLSNVIGKDNMVWQVNLGDDETKKILDKIGFLVWDGKMEAAMNHMNSIESKIFKVSSTAAISTGDLQGIGNLRSGAALETAHSPSIQKAKEMQITWSDNEEKFAYAIALFDAKIHSTTLEKRFQNYDFKIKFPQDSGVPGSEMLNAEVKQISINSHTKTMREIIEEDHPKFTKAEVESYYQEIIKDSETLVDANRKFETEQKAEGPSGGSSQKKSNEQSKQTK